MVETIVGLSFLLILVGVALSVAMLPVAILIELYLNYTSDRKDRKND